MVRWFLPAALLLAMAGAMLLATAQATPWQTDADAYFEGLNRIRADLYDGEESPEMASFDQASDDFHALQDRYRTSKWLFADLGYAAVAWSLLLALVSAFRADVRGSRSAWLMGAMTLGGGSLMIVGTIATGLQSMGRQQLPEWADSVGIVIFGAIGMGLFLIPMLVIFALAPLLFTQRQPEGLFAVRGRGWATSVVATMAYLPWLALGVLMQIGVIEAGGWAYSTGGALLIAVMLNARSVWLGRTIQPLP